MVGWEEAPWGGLGSRESKRPLPDARGHSADGLTSSGLGIDDAAGIVRADEAVQAHQAKIGVDAYFGEHGGEAEDRLRSVGLLDGIVVADAHQHGASAAR